MMKIHYIKTDGELFIFGVVSKKRKDFDGNNLVCVRAYDLSDNSRVNYQKLTNDGIVTADVAREFWDWVIDYGKTHGYPLKTSDAIYKTMDGSKFLTDSEIIDAMEELAWKTLTWETINKAKADGTFDVNGDYGRTVNRDMGYPVTLNKAVDEYAQEGKGNLQLVPKGTKHITMEDVAPHLVDSVHSGASATIVSEDELTESEKIAEQIFDKIGIITENYRG
jgi:hypothetical protein